MTKKITGLLLVFCVLVLLSSCKGYTRLLRSNDHELKYTKALEYYAKKDYGRSTPLLEDVELPFRGYDRADTIGYYIATGYYYQRDYYLAENYFDQFLRVYSRSPFSEEALFLQGMCGYMSSFRYELDQDPSIQAISVFNEYLVRYPRSERIPEVKKLLDELDYRLKEKAYFSARLYYDMEDYKAAVLALKNCLTEYSDTPFREELLFLIFDSSYQYAKNSITSKMKDRYVSSVDDYFTFVSEFPESKYRKDADRMYRAAVKAAKIDIGNPVASTEEELN